MWNEWKRKWIFFFFFESVNEFHIDFNQIIMQFSASLFFQCVTQYNNGWIERVRMTWKKESEVWKQKKCSHRSNLKGTRQVKKGSRDDFVLCCMRAKSEHGSIYIFCRPSPFIKQVHSSLLVFNHREVCQSVGDFLCFLNDDNLVYFTTTRR